MGLEAGDIPLATGEEIVAAIKEMDRETDERRYNAARVARLLRISDGTVWRHAEGWGMAFYRVGGGRHRLIRHADLVRWLKLRPEFGFALRELEEEP